VCTDGDRVAVRITSDGRLKVRVRTVLEERATGQLMRKHSRALLD
jgi:hypothetical protein